MIYNIIIIIISIILDGIFNLILKSTSYFLPLFTLMSLILIYPYFKNSKKDYITLSIITGLVYDLFNTSFLILNLIIFLIISDIIYDLFHHFRYTYIFIVLTSLFIIFVYQTLLLLIFNLTNYQVYRLDEFIYILPHYFIGNLIYITVLYFLSKKIIE